MGVVFDLPAFTVTSDGENLNASNAGFTINATVAAYGTTNQLLMADATDSAYGTSVTVGYLRDEVPGSTTQTVRVGVQRITSLAGHAWYAIAHATPGGNDYIAANYADSSNSLQVVKCINGTRTFLGSTATVAGISIGATATFGLRVSGSAGNWTAQCEYNGALVGSPVTITDSEVDGVGRMGVYLRGGTPSATTGLHAISLYGEDDTSGGGSSIAPISLNYNRLRRA